MMKARTPSRKENARCALRRANARQAGVAQSAPAPGAYLLAADAGNGGIDRKRSTRLRDRESTSIFHMPASS